MLGWCVRYWWMEISNWTFKREILTAFEIQSRQTSLEKLRQYCMRWVGFENNLKMRSGQSLYLRFSRQMQALATLRNLTNCAFALFLKYGWASNSNTIPRSQWSYLENNCTLMLTNLARGEPWSLVVFRPGKQLTAINTFSKENLHSKLDTNMDRIWHTSCWHFIYSTLHSLLTLSIHYFTLTADTFCTLLYTHCWHFLNTTLHSLLTLSIHYFTHSLLTLYILYFTH